MAKKYLDDIGLSHFFDKLKLLFATKDTATQSSDGLMSSSDKVKLDGLDQLVESATGESVTVGDSSGLESLIVYGKSVQGGTPTPSAPVPIEVVESPFLAVTVYKSGYSIGATGTESQLSNFNILSCNVSGRSSVYLSYTQVSTNATNNRFHAYDSNGAWLSQIDVMQTENGTYKTAITLPSGTAELRISTRINTTINYVYVGSQEPAHVESSGCIGLVVGDTTTSIQLQSNVLASLPDGTKDVLTVDSVGHCVLEKHTGYITSYNGESVGDNYISTTSELSTGASVYYELATAQTIDLGYIDIPDAFDGTVVSIVAAITPTINVSWWTVFAEPIANAIKCIKDLILQQS